ncbi:MAG: CPBP family intramembrane metalloprotease, partial [Mariniblastus sp.]|nr:CPBP family intramembrane metalloprotease [Mariniblastus sp.]
MDSLTQHPVQPTIRRSVFILSPSSNLADLVTLFVFLAGAFTSIWLPDRIEPQILFGATLLWMSWNAWFTRSVLDTRTHRRWYTSWIQLTALTLLAAGVLYFACRCTGAYHGHKSFEIFDKSGGHWLTTKLPTVLGQQIMLQLLLVPLLSRIFKQTRTTVWVGAFIFAALHLPNPALMVLTFLAGATWIFVYSRSRQLTPIVVSHFALAIFAAGLCGEYVLNMRIGPSCVALFPTYTGIGKDQKMELPNCIVGSVERLVQNGDQLTLTGWILDPIHRVAPTAMFSTDGEQLREIKNTTFRRVPATDWENASKAGFVNAHCYSFVTHIPANDANLSNGINLMAANANGYLGKLSQMGEIKSLHNSPKDHSVVLFPVEVDGRINQIVRTSGQLHLRGWAADLQHTTLVDSLHLEWED